MWSNVFYYYNKLKKNTDISNQYMINLNIGNIFTSHGRYTKSIQNYEEGIIHLQATNNNNNRLLAIFILNCGIAQIFLGNNTNSLVNFQKATQLHHSIVISYNIVLYHFIFSSISELQKAYIELVQKSIEIDITEQEKSEQFNLIIKASCLVVIKNKEMYEFVIEQLKQSQYFELIKEFETTFSNEESRDLIKENLSFVYFVEKNCINLNQFMQIQFQMNEYEASILVNKGKSLLSNNQAKDAIKLFKNAIEIYPNHYEAQFNLAIAYESLELYNDAIKILLELDKNGLKDNEILLNLSICYDKIDDINKEIDYIHEMLNIDPYDSKLWHRLGSIWQKFGNEKYTLQCYIKCISIDQTEIELISWLETNYIQNNKCNELLTSLQNSECYQNNPIILMLIALCYEKMNNKLKAIEEYEKVIQIDPTNKKCLSILIRLTNEMKLFQKNEYYKHFSVQE